MARIPRSSTRTRLVIMWIKVLNENVHSDQIASHHLSSRGMLVFGMYISIVKVSTEPQDRYFLALLPPNACHIGLLPATRRILIWGLS